MRHLKKYLDGYFPFAKGGRQWPTLTRNEQFAFTQLSKADKCLEMQVLIAKAKNSL